MFIDKIDLTYISILCRRELIKCRMIENTIWIGTFKIPFTKLRTMLASFMPKSAKIIFTIRNILAFLSITFGTYN